MGLAMRKKDSITEPEFPGAYATRMLVEGRVDAHDGDNNEKLARAHCAPPRDAERDQERDRRRLPVEPGLDDSAVEDQADHVLVAEVTCSPRLPIGFDLAPDAGDRRFANHTAKQARERARNPAGVGSREIGRRDHCIDWSGAMSMGGQRLVPPPGRAAVRGAQSGVWHRHRGRPESSNNLARALATTMAMCRFDRCRRRRIAKLSSRCLGLGKGFQAHMPITSARGPQLLLKGIASMKLRISPRTPASMPSPQPSSVSSAPEPTIGVSVVRA